MGRKKKNKKNKQELKKICFVIICFIILLLISKTDALQIIDNAIANTGLAEIVDTSTTANVSTTPTVKTDNEIITKVSENIVIDENKLNILFLDVGQADCELIISNGKTMLIDSGNSKDGEIIVNGLKALGITKIDYVIGTHVHEDHIGGMSYIIDSFDVGEFYLPYNTTTTSSYYKKLLNSLSQKSLNINEAVVGDKFEVGNATCEIMSVDNSEPEDANDSSVVIEMTYGDLKYLFMGDATSTNEKSRNWNDVDVLKVGHHGSNTSSSEDFLNQVLPEIAVISVGEGNSYGLPKDKIIDRLNKIGSTIYRTDEDGTIQIVSDGKTNEVTKIDISFDG